MDLSSSLAWCGGSDCTEQCRDEVGEEEEEEEENLRDGEEGREGERECPV
jgi:hypothetical protein